MLAGRYLNIDFLFGQLYLRFYFTIHISTVLVTVLDWLIYTENPLSDYSILITFWRFGH